MQATNGQLIQKAGNKWAVIPIFGHQIASHNNIQATGNYFNTQTKKQAITIHGQ